MLDSLLIFLLPYRPNEVELHFHVALVQNACEQYREQFVATGYRDRETLRAIQQYTRYSMRVLFWWQFRTWWRYRRFLHRAWWVAKIVTPLNRVQKVLPNP
jgi:hypothetical protein